MNHTLPFIFSFIALVIESEPALHISASRMHDGVRMVGSVTGMVASLLILHGTLGDNL
jgi:hypothetical protein